MGSEVPILVVDPTPSNLKLLRIILISEAYTVRVAVDGEDALLALRTLQPRLIVIELHMRPAMAAAEFIRAVRANPATRDVPILAMASSDTEGAEWRPAMAAGCTACCTKPIDTRTFLPLIANLLAP